MYNNHNNCMEPITNLKLQRKLSKNWFQMPTIWQMPNNVTSFPLPYIYFLKEYKYLILAQ